MLAGHLNFRELLKGRDTGGIQTTGTISVSRDFLDHICLCMVDGFEEWRAYALEHHRSEVGVVAALGPWQARRWLSLEIERGEEPLAPLAKAVADRFFGGVVMLEILRPECGV